MRETKVSPHAPSCPSNKSYFKKEGLKGNLGFLFNLVKNFYYNLVMYITMATTSSTPDLGNLVPLKNGLARDQKCADIISALVLRIKALPNFQTYKADVEVLLLCCNTVEHLVVKTDKIDKSKLVIDALTQIFSLTPDEQALTKITIDFLNNHNRIKTVSQINVAKNAVWDWVQKKLL